MGLKEKAREAGLFYLTFKIIEASCFQDWEERKIGTIDNFIFDYYGVQYIAHVGDRFEGRPEVHQHNLIGGDGLV